MPCTWGKMLQQATPMILANSIKCALDFVLTQATTLSLTVLWIVKEAFFFGTLEKETLQYFLFLCIRVCHTLGATLDALRDRFCIRLGEGASSFWHKDWPGSRRIGDKVSFVHVNDLNLTIADVFYLLGLRGVDQILWSGAVDGIFTTKSATG
ncbi:hypothetical protein RJT34_27098 [Clitoria ternatea]|uniref:Uncharacterized protein n=1 Tax=Clitoria ternatea TaxID=43366 RepID=A0AAN9F9M8_CLITE